MQALLRKLVFIPLLLAVATPAAASADALAEALKAAAARDYARADQLARTTGDPVAADLVTWRRLRDGSGTWDEYVRFLNRNADWPGLSLVRARAERIMPRGLPADQVRAFFSVTPPQTGTGALVLSVALGGDAGARERARAWTGMEMNPEERAAYLNNFGRELAPLHAARLDALLWEGETKAAAEMLSLVPAGVAALGRARIALQEDANGVDALIAAVPRDQAADAGLAYDRFRWRIRKGFRASATELLAERSASAQSLGRPEAWANNRRSLARDAMRAGDGRGAYALASRHHLTEGSHYADLEWLSGYVALTQLNDPVRALQHFDRFRKAVVTPISLGRAGYWQGRAAEAAGDAALARQYYGFGAVHQTSFYGQLAAERAGLPVDPLMQRWGGLPTWNARAFARTTPVHAARLLAAANERGEAERFLLHVQEALGAEDSMALARLAVDLDLVSTALKIGKRLAEQGVIVPEAYYPVTSLAKQATVIPGELAMAIARQESELNPEAISPAGARGLMQLMPATAKKVSGELGLDYSAGRLTADPAYNARLGTQYLADMLKRYDGSVLLAAAAYNAGPGRVDQWLVEYGDPRAPGADPIRWIENIPFRETQNYVMRILESLHVYRTRIARQAGPIGLQRTIAPRG